MGQWSIFCYKYILKGKKLAHMFLKKIAFGQLIFFQMKPNWLLRFHVYHTFGDYLYSHEAILVIAKLCLSIYFNETNLPMGNCTLTTKGLAD
jgi:hypothetical protein